MPAFLSYARANQVVALRLAEELRAQGTHLWVDQVDIPLGAHWDISVQEALTRSEAVIVLLSQASVSSQNVLDELAFALEEGKLIIPIMLEPCIKPFRSRRIQHIAFTTVSEVASSIRAAINISDASKHTFEGLDTSVGSKSVPQAPQDESNPQLLAAAKLLSLAKQVLAQQREAYADLRARVLALVSEYFDRVQELGSCSEEAMIGKYLLCVALDEFISLSGETDKINESHPRLTLHFFSDTNGGEKFFQLLDRLSSSSEKYRDLLILIQYILNIGFRGKYYLVAEGERELLQVKSKLATLIGRG